MIIAIPIPAIMMASVTALTIAVITIVATITPSLIPREATTIIMVTCEVVARVSSRMVTSVLPTHSLIIVTSPLIAVPASITAEQLTAERVIVALLVSGGRQW